MNGVAAALRVGMARIRALAWPRFWRPERRKLRVRETLSLGNRGFLAVIECESEQLLIGGTANSLALLTKLPRTSVGEWATANSETRDEER